MKKEESMTNRQLKAQETKKLLFDTSIRLILARGFHNVYIEDIAREAGTSTGLFYKYFKSKDEIVVEHYKLIDEIYINTYKNLDKKNTVTEKLLILFKSGFDFTEGLGKEFLSVLLTNQFSQRGTSYGYVMDEKRPIYKIIHEIVEEGIKTGEFRNDLSADTIVSMLSRAYIGSYFEWTLMNDKPDLMKDGLDFIHLFINAAIKT